VQQRCDLLVGTHSDELDVARSVRVGYLDVGSDARARQFGAAHADRQHDARAHADGRRR
jgi:hypothetical protein